MKKLLVASAISAMFALPAIANAQAAAPAAAPTPEHTFTGNATLVSDYRFRGISQTYKLPAIQAGFDYAHSSGFYLGTWASSVSANSYPNGAGLEWDLYGGYKGTLPGDVGFDVGFLEYYYPGAHYNNPPTNTKTNNTELYGALSYQWFTAKYSHSLSDFFGINSDSFGGACISVGDCLGTGNSRGSGYLDLSANFEIADKLTLGVHLGHQSVKNYTKLAYTDYKIGLTKDVGGWLFGAAVIGTDAKKGWYTIAEPSGANPKVVSGTTLVLSLGKTF